MFANLMYSLFSLCAVQRMHPVPRWVAVRQDSSGQTAICPLLWSFVLQTNKCWTETAVNRLDIRTSVVANCASETQDLAGNCETAIGPGRRSRCARDRVAFAFHLKLLIVFPQGLPFHQRLNRRLQGHGLLWIGPLICTALDYIIRSLSRSLMRSSSTPSRAGHSTVQAQLQARGHWRLGTAKLRTIRRKEREEL